MKNKALYNLVVSAMLFALGILLPFLTGQMADIGNMLLPMHLPVLLCGFIAGPWYGAVVGATLPIIRSLMLGMPPLFPNAVTMAFELCAYGLLTGIFYYVIFKKKNLCTVYISLVSAMIIGRIIKGIANAVCYGMISKTYTLWMFISGAFIEAVPGIVIQLILIPAILVATRKAGIK